MIVLAGALAACGTTASSYQFRGTEPAAGADADLRLTEREQNYEVDLKVDNLLPPERVQPGAQAYAVWLKPEGEERPFHVGNLEYNDDRRRGELRTVTPHSHFDVFVTAEPSASPQEPEGPTVLSETVQERR